MLDSVIIPVLGRLDLLDRCIASLTGRIASLIIIDNGDELQDERVDGWWQAGYLDSVDRVYVWRMPFPLSVASSWNLGIKATPHARGWLLLNSDAWFHAGAFEEYAAACEPNRIVLAGEPGWCCAFIGEDVVNRVGLFSEQFHPAYMEDVDYERRAHVLGFDVVKSGAHVGHDNSSTIRSDPDRAAKNAVTHAKNHAYYEARWRDLGAEPVPRCDEWTLETRRANSWE